MDCCRVIAPDVVVETVVGATVVVVVLRVLFVLELGTDRSTGFVLSWTVGVPSTPVDALKGPVRTLIAKLLEEALATVAVASGRVTLKVHWTLFPVTLARTSLALHVEVNGVNMLFARVAQMNVT